MEAADLPQIESLLGLFCTKIIEPITRLRQYTCLVLMMALVWLLPSVRGFHAFFGNYVERRDDDLLCDAQILLAYPVFDALF
ncbi:hypothetical protein A9Q99_10035 [Gammaproteobacteria bacterium 45_16_T64]|nr:hypothetical protein A9Q99_10035 [Gammaproteobacteria bacterium 45_16_T64]